MYEYTYIYYLPEVEARLRVGDVAHDQHAVVELLAARLRVKHALRIDRFPGVNKG